MCECVFAYMSEQLHSLRVFVAVIAFANFVWSPYMCVCMEMPKICVTCAGL